MAYLMMTLRGHNHITCLLGNLIKSGCASHATTVNVDIFAQLNFCASSPRRHFRVDKFSRIGQLTLSVL